MEKSKVSKMIIVKQGEFSLNSLVKYIFMIFCIMCFFSASAQTAVSWGDGQPLGVRESASTDIWNPGRYAIDGNNNTAWRLSEESNNGWLERYWDADKRLESVSVNLELPDGVDAQVCILNGKCWEAIPGGVIYGPYAGVKTVVLPGEFPSTRKVLLKLNGTGADSAWVYEISVSERSGPDRFSKITPKSTTINVGKYITIDPERLCDGVYDNAWYEPLWSIPREIVNLLTKKVFDSIFPSYMGNPQKQGEIIWELDGKKKIETLKAYFIQDGRRLRFEFWNGSSWGNACDIYGNRGWQRFDIPGGIISNRVRLTFPGGWELARFIGEAEIWGEGWDDTKPIQLPVPASLADNGYWFTVDTQIRRDIELQISVYGITGESLALQWNGSSLDVAPIAWVGGSTVYRTRFERDELRNDVQFLKVISARKIEGVKVNAYYDEGRIDLGWPWNDGQLEDAISILGKTVPSISSQEWSLENVYNLEKIRVYTTQGSSLRFYTKKNDEARNGNGHRQNNVENREEISWTALGDGWMEANLSGRIADVLIAESDVPVNIGEIELFGSICAQKKPRLEVYWPKDKKDQESDNSVLVGWLGDSRDQVEASGFHPRQQDHLFWMPLKDMAFGPGEHVRLDVNSANGKGKTIKRCVFNWKEKNPEATLRQGLDLVSTLMPSIVLSGTVSKRDTRLFVQGVETPIVGYSYNVTIPLLEGFQLIRLEFWDKQHKHLLQYFEKPVWKPAHAPDLVFDQPAGDIWTQLGNLEITGRVGNSVGITLHREEQQKVISEQGFAEIVPLSNGYQTIRYMVRDAAGQSATYELTVQRDSIEPQISFITPHNGQYFATSTVEVSLTSVNDGALWWKFNDDPWEVGYDAIKTRIDALADGYHHYRVYAQDRSGNVSSPVDVQFCVDTVLPESFIVAANVSGWTNENRPTLSFSTNDITSGVLGFQYSADGSTWIDAVSPFCVPTLADGVHTVFIAAFDRAGNRRTESIDLKIDTTTPPVPQGLSLVPGVDRIKILWTGIQDGEGFQSYRIERNPTWPDAIRSSDETAYGNQSYFDTDVEIKSEYQYRVWAVDRAGNESAKTDWVKIVAGLASEQVVEDGPTIVNFNHVRVELPDGATSNDIIRVQINEVPFEGLIKAPEQLLLGKTYAFTVVRSDITGERVTPHADFLVPVSVWMDYDPALLPSGFNEVDVRPYYYDDIWGRWVAINGSMVDTVNHTVYFTTRHFSEMSIQATKAADLSPQELRDVRFSPIGTKVSHGSISVSPETGSVTTSFTEAVLPGINEFDLILKRVYDTTTAQGDGDPSTSSGKDGDEPWKIAKGWRLQFPSMTWNSNGLWVRGLDGASFSINQAVIQTEEDGDDTTVWMTTHESSDVRFAITFTTQTTQNAFLLFHWDTTTSNMKSATVYMKDGRSVEFNEEGRVTAMYDPTGGNKILFDYGNNLTTITDSRGRVVSIAYTNGLISSMSIQASITNNQNTRNIVYTVDTNGCLTNALDIGNRNWVYQNTKFTKNISYKLKNSTENAINGTPVDFYALTKVSGPGIGVSAIAYRIDDCSYDDTQDGRTWIITRGRLMGTDVNTYLTEADIAVSPLRTIKTVITLNSVGKGQFIAKDSTVSDGRIITKTLYTAVPKTRHELSEATEALGSIGMRFGMRDAESETLTYQSSVSRSYSDTKVVFETETQVWDEEHMRMRSQKIERSSTNYKLNELEYDDWGNITSKTGTQIVGTRKSGTIISNTYYNQEPASADIDQGYEVGGNVDLVLPNTYARYQKNLLASRKTESYGFRSDTADNTKKYSTTEFEAYKYNSLGQIEELYKMAPDSAWANTSYEYNDLKKRISKKTNPTEQISNYTYDDLENEYRITIEQANVKLSQGAGLTDVVTRSAYDIFSGQEILSIDARGYATKKEYDALGRTTDIYEAADSDAILSDFPASGFTPGSANVHTNISYSDTADGNFALSSTVETPNKLSTKYGFDALGRLISIEKTNKILSAAAKAKGYSDTTGEIITTTLAYDAWDQIVETHGPFSSIETGFNSGRTLAGLVTKYKYDLQGRIKEIESADGEKKLTQYNDQTNTVTTENEEDEVIDRVMGWDNTVLMETRFTTSDDSINNNYYDGRGRLIYQVDPIENTTSVSYNELGLEDSAILQERDVYTASESGLSTAAKMSPETTKSYYIDGSLKKVTQKVDINASNNRSSTNTSINGLGMVLTASSPVVTDGISTEVLVESSYDGNGNCLSKTTRYSKDSSFCNKTEWTYDSHGRVLTEKVYSSATEFAISSYTYDAEGNKLSYTDPRGNAKNGLSPKYSGEYSVTFTYDMLNRLISGTMPKTIGQTTNGIVEFAYDGKGNLVQRKDADDVTTNYTYNLINLLEQESITGGGKTLITQYEYDKTGRLVKKILPDSDNTSGNSRIQKTEYDELGRVEYEGRADEDGNYLSGYSHNIYDPAGNRTQVVDRNGNPTSYSYNPERKLLKTTDALGNIWETKYNALNEPVSSIDPESNEQLFMYDSLGRVIQEKTPIGTKKQYEYDAAGNVITAIDGRETTFSRTYLRNNLLATEIATGTDDTSEMVSYFYDEAGSLKTSNNGTVATQYNIIEGAYRPDPYGLITTISQSYNALTLSSSFRYDSMQRMISVTDPAARSTSYAYNALGQLEKVENTTAANSIDWINGSLQYDVGGRFSEFALGNGIKKNVNYDDADRMTNLNYELPIEKQAAKKIKSYVYGFDEVDNIESKTVDGNTPNSYTYDERNMLKNADEYGKFQKAPSALDHTSFYKADRDFDGNKALEINELGWDNDIRLDAASRSICIDLDTPHTINNIELVPKNANHRVAQDDISIYLPIDDLPENGWEIFNDWRIVKDTDTGRMKIIFNTSVVTTYIKINTTWDDRDVDNNSIETGVRPFANTPDALIRVWTFQDSRQEVYEYDSIGNRLSSTSDGNSSSYVYEKNANGKNTTLLQEDSTWTYEYDGNGNLISKTRNEDVSQALSAEDKLAANHWDYEYDLHDRLTKVKRDGTVVASYVYDASGMRIARNGADGTSTCYSYSPNGKLLYETIRNGTQNIYERSSVLIGSTIIGWTEKVNNVEKAYFAITDHLGSVTVITDKDGQAVWRSEYSPYGTINGAEGSIDFQGIFTGKEVDLETGLYYFNARWYDPETGRFITEDPARDGVNWYAYCGNNPLNRIDPTGLSDKAPGMPSDVENKGYGQGTEYKGYNYTEGDPESGEQYDEDVLNEVARLARIAEFKQNSKEFGIGFFITAKKAYINQIKTVILGGGYVGNQIGSSLGGIIIDPVGTIDSGKRYLGQVLRGDPRTWGGIAYSVVEIVVAGVTIGALTEASVITIEAPAASKGGKQLLLDAPKMADHHLFPQQFRDAFKKMGINIDDFTVSVPQNTTHLKGLHGKGFNELPGGWNKAWQQFFTDNPGATAKDAFQFGGSLMDKYGLNGLPVSPY